MKKQPPIFLRYEDDSDISAIYTVFERPPYQGLPHEVTNGGNFFFKWR
jgi:hypothetical protein